jgi:hypothetical protein
VMCSDTRNVGRDGPQPEDTVAVKSGVGIGAANAHDVHRHRVRRGTPSLMTCPFHVPTHVLASEGLPSASVASHRCVRRSSGGQHHDGGADADRVLRE